MPLGASGTPIQYADPEYWDARYRRQPADFDWFYGWEATRKLIRAYIPRGKPCLHIGCGNSNLQAGMASHGYYVVNVDVSKVIIDQMKIKHAGMRGLEYFVADCRDLKMFTDCRFFSALDKGTLDALLCEKHGLDNIDRMMKEITRVLVPGAIFLEISLGSPSQRLPLMCHDDYEWEVSVCLLPLVSDDQMLQIPDRPLPTNDTLKPVKHLGPFSPEEACAYLDKLPEEMKGRRFFYAYVCRKAKIVLQDNSRVVLPTGWKGAVEEETRRLEEQLGLPPFALSSRHSKSRSGRGALRRGLSTDFKSRGLLAEQLMWAYQGRKFPGSGDSLEAGKQKEQPDGSGGLRLEVTDRQTISMLDGDPLAGMKRLKEG